MSAIIRMETIGDCVLYQGDAREIAPLLRYQSIVCDPPFGMAFRSNHRTTKHNDISGDKTAELLVWVSKLEAEHSKYVFCRWDNLREIPSPKSCITWVKNNWSMGDLEHEHGRQTEVCAFYPGPKHFFPSGRPADVINCARTGNEFHPTEKPVQLMQAVVKWTDGTVLDCMMGSGSTLVACAKLGRRGIGIEIDPTHFQTACERVQKAYDQPDLFVPQPAPAVQQGWDL